MFPLIQNQVKFSCYVVILTLQWKIMYIILDKGLWKSSLLFKPMKTSRASRSSRVSFLWSFSQVVSLPLSPKVWKIFFVGFVVIIKKNWRIWFFVMCRPHTVLHIPQYLLTEEGKNNFQRKCVHIFREKY